MSMGVRGRLEGVCNAYVLAVTLISTGETRRYPFSDSTHMLSSVAQDAITFSGKNISMDGVGRSVNVRQWLFPKLRGSLLPIFNKCSPRIVNLEREE